MNSRVYYFSSSIVLMYLEMYRSLWGKEGNTRPGGLPPVEGRKGGEREIGGAVYNAVLFLSSVSTSVSGVK